MMRRESRHQQQQEHQAKVFYDLSALVLNILRSPPTPIDFSDEIQPRRRPPERSELMVQQITPAGFASLLLGVSLALMLSGSVTFFIGFMLMPWVLGLVIFLYFVGIISSISMIGRAILCYVSSPPPPRKDASSWKLL